ncbi:hypothetical protein DITRI_Ditri14bG0125500 [Diplodiscus trichospermus]
MSWYFSVVYGSPNCGLRKHLWAQLNEQFLGFGGPWIAAGDFNVVMSKEEVNFPDTLAYNHCVGFMDWMFDNGLMDMGYIGTKFTWMREFNLIMPRYSFALKQGIPTSKIENCSQTSS